MQKNCDSVATVAGMINTDAANFDKKKSDVLLLGSWFKNAMLITAAVSHTIESSARRLKSKPVPHNLDLDASAPSEILGKLGISCTEAPFFGSTVAIVQNLPPRRMAEVDKIMKERDQLLKERDQLMKDFAGNHLRHIAPDQSVALPFEIFPDGQDNGAQDEQPAAADTMTVPADEPADDAEDSAVPRAAMILKTTPAKPLRLPEPFEEQGRVRRRKEDHSPQSKALFHPDEQGYRCPSPQQKFLTQTSLGSNKSRLKQLSEVET